MKWWRRRRNVEREGKLLRCNKKVKKKQEWPSPWIQFSSFYQKESSLGMSNPKKGI